MGHPKAWIAILSAGVLVWVSLGDFGKTSPGPLAASHANVPALQGSDSCAKCHGGWFGSMAEACLKCHEDVKAHIEEERGLHGILAKRQDEKGGGVDVMDCAKCHTDHHGEDFLMVNRQSFALSGIGDFRKFDHALIGYEMEGKHKELDCGRCHFQVDIDALREGQKRFLGLSQECGTCHDDPHKGSFGETCTNCHSQESFQDVYHVEHDRFLPLKGGHGELDCAECHKPGTKYEIRGLKQSQVVEKRTCTDCHQSPHEAAFVKDTKCADCHEPEHASFADADKVLTPEQHAKTGFTLAVPHDEVTCAQCHKGDYLPFKERFPGRQQDDCKSCHGDPHGGQFEHGLFNKSGCLTCHTRHAFEPHRFTDRMHTKAGFKLTGAHVEADCHACHKRPQKDLPRQFDKTPRSCAGCHEDAHRGAFKGKAGSCNVCHTTRNFQEHRRPFLHGKWTGFALSGAHAQEECASCHKPRKKPDKTGRTFGRIAKYEGCVTCHVDPHRGAFARQGFKNCAECHTDVSFRVLPKDFDHGAATGFPLDGAHGETSCSQCHPRRRKPDRFGRTWEPARGKQCADCHEDPHAGQFEAKGVTDCQRCHQSTMSFSELTFDHQKDTRFPLDDQHKQVDCAGCHKPVRTKTGQFVRYKPLGMRCVDCHKAQRDPLRRGRKR